MDRGIRYLLASTLFLATSFITVSVIGAPPTIGKLPGNNKTAPATKVTRPTLNQGLLGGLFAPKEDNRKVEPNAHLPAKDPVSWEGIPYHEPGKTQKSTTNRSTAVAPIRDPRKVPTPPRSIRAIPAATRIMPRAAKSIVEPIEAPAPIVSRREGPVVRKLVSPEVVVNTEIVAEDQLLSDSESSRRTGRRSVGALDLSEIQAASKEPAEDVQDLVPKVARRQLVTEEPKTAVETIAKAPEPAVEPEAAADAEPPAHEPQPVAEVETPAVQQQPAATLSAPSPAPAPAPVPMAGVPSRQLAQSPRLQAPTSSFQPRQLKAPTFNTISSPIGSGVVPEPQSGDVATFRKPKLMQPQPAPTYQTPYVAQQPQQPQYDSIEDVRSAQLPVDPYAIQSPEAAPVPAPAPLAAKPVPVPVQAPTPAPLPVETPEPAPAAAVPMHPIHSYPQPTPEIEEAPETIPPVNNVRETEPGHNIVASELPGIRVVTNGPSSIMIRQTHQFEIRVENRGSIDADGVMVRAQIPDWAEVNGHTASRGNIEPKSVDGSERLVWVIDHLPAGTSERMFVRLRAERSGTHPLDVDWTLVPQKSVTKVHVHQPELALTIEGPDEVVYGQSQTYKVRVLNPGDGIAPNVVFTLSPNSATPQTQRIGDIPSGKEAQFEVELTAMDLGNLKIHGLATGDLELRAEAAKNIRVAAANLEAILTGPEIKYRDTDALYNLQLQNTGVATSKDVLARLRLPAGAKYLSGLEGAQQRGQVLSWRIDALTPGAVRNYQVKCKMLSAGDQMFMFDCKGTAAGQSDVALTTKVESISDLVMTINDPIAPAPVGSEVTYEVLIKNRGSREAKDVRAIAQFSHGIEPVRVTGHAGEVITGQVLLETIPRIGAGEQVKISIVAVAERAGHHRFRTEIRSGDTVLVAEEATHYMSPKSERVSRRSSNQSVIR